MKTPSRSVKIALFGFAIAVAIGSAAAYRSQKPMLAARVSGIAAKPVTHDLDSLPTSQPRQAGIRSPDSSSAGGAGGSQGSRVVGGGRSKAGASDDAACRERMRKLGVVNTAQCMDIGAIVNDLATGTYVFNKPKTAYVGKSFRLLLALKTSTEQDVNPSFAGLVGAVTEREGKFAQSLEASLRGDDLKIEPAGPQMRTATSTNSVEWEWTLTPQSGGEKTLIIEVLANIQAGPDRHKVQIRTLREPIVIETSTFDQIRMYVAEVSGIVVAASAAVTAMAGVVGFVPPIRQYVLKMWRRRRDSRVAASTD
jgi:hypothetical protein